MTCRRGAAMMKLYSLPAAFMSHPLPPPATAIHIREQERERIARDLHDDLGGVLAGVGMALGRLQEQLAAQGLAAPLAEADEARQLLQQAMASMHDIIDELHPPIVEFGLVDALQWQCRQIQREYRLHCQLDCPPALEQEDRFLILGLLRILREAASNAARHGRASALRVDLRMRQARLEMQIADDGCGIAPLHAKEGATRHGHGLRNMRERAQALGGELFIEAGQDGGVVIRTLIPVAR